ncbi:hypothetical protein AJ88_05110 [Mesorhizobium amorphae CCBAU 01583]|nr:hypothetical protein AJ88_05110 [Mesorhizobium amorphae CCBAU 01583]
MEPDEKAKNDTTVGDHSEENGAAEVTASDEERDISERKAADPRDVDIGVNQASEAGDDVDMAVSIIGSSPAIVKLDAEVDQKGEMDQDAETASETGDPGGREIDIAAEQRPEVDQRIEVDVEVSEDDGIIIVEIDAEVEDDVEIESDLDVDVDDDDEDSLEAEIDQETETDGNVDVDVEIRDDLDAEVDVDIAALIKTALLGAVDVAEKDDATDIDVDLYEKAAADGDVGVIVDLSDIDA